MPRNSKVIFLRSEMTLSGKINIEEFGLSQDDVTGDGTTSTVLLIGEFLKQAELYISEGLHPRVVTEGFEVAKNKALEILEDMKVPITDADRKDVLTKIAATSLKTKIHPKVILTFPSD